MHVFARQFSILLQQFFAHVFIHGPAFFSRTVRATGAQYFSRRTAHNGNCSRVRTNQGSRKRTIAIDLSVCKERIRLIQLCMVNAQPLCKCNQCIIFCWSLSVLRTIRKNLCAVLPGREQRIRRAPFHFAVCPWIGHMICMFGRWNQFSIKLSGCEYAILWQYQTCQIFETIDCQRLFDHISGIGISIASHAVINAACHDNACKRDQHFTHGGYCKSQCI